MNASVLNGSIQLITSTGNTQPGCTVTFEDFTVSGGGIVFDNGTAGPFNAGGETQGAMNNVCVLGVTSYNDGTTTRSSAIYLRGAYQFAMSNVFCQGSSVTSNYGLTVDACSNLQAVNFTAYTYLYGIYAPPSTNSLGAAGWQMSNIRLVSVEHGLYAVWSTNQGAFINNIMVDNGTGLTTSAAVPIYMQGTTGVNACIIVGGEILTASGHGQYGIQLVGMKHVVIKDIDFTFGFFSGSGGAAVFISSTSTFNTVQGCTPPAAGFLVSVDSTSTGNLAVANTRDATSGFFTNAGGASNVLTPVGCLDNPDTLPR